MIVTDSWLVSSIWSRDSLVTRGQEAELKSISKGQCMGDIISFSNNNLQRVYTHDGTIIVSMIIANYDIKRILIDSTSMTDVWCIPKNETACWPTKKNQLSFGYIFWLFSCSWRGCHLTNDGRTRVSTSDYLTHIPCGWGIFDLQRYPKLAWLISILSNRVYIPPSNKISNEAWDQENLRRPNVDPTIFSNNG